MADFDDLPGFTPPPTRPVSAFALEAERRRRADAEGRVVTARSTSFMLRGVLRRAAGSSTAMLVLATVMVGGTVALTRSVRAPEQRRVLPSTAAPAAPPRATAEVPEPSLAGRTAAHSPRSDRRPQQRDAGDRTTFRFSSLGAAPSAPAAHGGASGVASADRHDGPGESRGPAPQPSPEPTPSPHTPTSILMRLVHPNGAYFFTTSAAAAMEKEGYEGYESERAALVWSERRGPTMIRLELSDDSVAFVYAREQDVPSGEPLPLYSASTRRYGRFYSLDREQAAEIGTVVVYGWVARY